MVRCIGIVFLSFGLLLTTNAQPSSNRRTASELAAIRSADQAWLHVFASKNLKASVDFVTPTGSVMAPNAPIATGHDAIRSLFSGFFTLPDLKISWQPSSVEASGTLGYSAGAYQMSYKDPSGKIIEDRGKYVTIWKKRAGRWLVEYDIFNSDLPATP